MSTDLSRTIGELVLARLGFSPTDLLWQRFSRVVQQQARHAGFPSPEDYLRHLVRASDDELEQLAEALTINETYFFREAKHFDALRQLLPELARETRTVRLLSAGCASGEEAYSLAITAHRVLQPAGIDFEVVGVDIDRRAIERARAGRYRQWSFREHGLEHAQPYVRQVQGWWVVREDIRQHVRFEHLNLTERLPPGPFHVVFCRNTLMYLTAANRRDVVARLAELLPPGGLLVIGSAETLDVLPPGLARVTIAGSHVYRRQPSSSSVEIARAQCEFSQRVRVMLASRSPINRVVLRQLLQAARDIELVAEVRSPDQLAQRLGQVVVDVVLLDAIDDPSLVEAVRDEWGRRVPVLRLTRGLPGLPRGTGLLALPDTQPQTLRAHAEELARRLRAVADRGPRPQEPGIGTPAARRSGVWEHLLLIGCSTGGPAVITRILQRLPVGLGLAVVVVQHMPAAFTRSFAERLNRSGAYTVREAESGDRLEADTVYVAPGQHNTLVLPGGRLKVESPLPGDIYVPNIDRTFLSVVRAGLAQRALAAILTGMGDDGAAGMAQLAAGGAVTLAQDPREAVVAGMIEAAVARGAVQKVLPADDIPDEIVRRVSGARRVSAGRRPAGMPGGGG